MNQSRIAEALALQQRRDRSGVITREILRIVATLDPPDGADRLGQVRKEVLIWAQRRSGGQLPDAAWNGESFEHLAGGRTVLALRVDSEDAVVWALRADDPDKRVAGRVWTTEVAMRVQNGIPPELSVRQSVSSSEIGMRINPHVPGLLLQIAEKCKLTVGGIHIQSRPIRIASEEDVGTLVSLLQDRDRHLPIIVASGDERAPDPKAPLVDVESIARATLGLALVVEVPASYTYALSNAFGKVRSAYYGAIRVYLPGFDDSADPYIHRLFLGDSVMYAPEATENELRWLVAKDSLRRTRLGQDLLTFAGVRSAAAKSKQAAARHASGTEQLLAAQAHIEALEKEIEAAREQADQNFDIATGEEDRADRAEEIQHGLRARVEHLERALAARGIEPYEGITYPQQWEDFSNWCDENLSGSLVLASQARRGIKKARFDDLSVAAECLCWLASEGRKRRIDGGGTLANIPIKPGVENAPCGHDSFEFTWQDRRMTADWHVKNGGNTRDPQRCFRIYYCFDERTQQIVVADMPAHRRTGAS